MHRKGGASVTFSRLSVRAPASCRAAEREAAVQRVTLANAEERARLTETAATLGAREAALAHQEVRPWGEHAEGRQTYLCRW